MPHRLAQAFQPLCLTLIGMLLSLNLLAAQLQNFPGARLIPTDWADGDSFEVQFADGQRHTVRLYGADTLELHVSDRTDARRLRSQRRYFGITDVGRSVPDAIALAKSLGAEGKSAVQRLLARPFTVHTAFADGGGDGRYKRIYGFITLADGRDLAAVLISEGLARAYGVYRASPQGRSRDDYREHLKDVELRAAARRQGARAYTHWDRLITQRDEERREESELNAAAGRAPPTGTLNINTAARDELMRIPGIGEHFANAIIENRPYRRLEELTRVPGIGKKRLSKLREWVDIEP